MDGQPLLKIRSADSLGSWLVEDHRYYENAHALLMELEAIIVEVQKQWPKPLNKAVKQKEASAELWALARKRDLLSDAVKVFSAMSVEAFLNFYGVVRLGQAFDKNLERLGPVQKLKRLFELCEKIILSDTDPLVEVVDRIAKRRNRLVHPQAIEVVGEVASSERGGDKIPDVARAAVADMVMFFMEFGKRDPNVIHHLPSSPGSNAQHH